MTSTKLSSFGHLCRAVLCRYSSCRLLGNLAAQLTAKFNRAVRIVYCKKLSERIVYSKQWSNVLRSDFNICDLYSEVKRKDINCSYQEHWIVHYQQQRLTHSLCITTVILEVNYIAVVLISRTNVTSVGSAVKITKTI